METEELLALLDLNGKHLLAPESSPIGPSEAPPASPAASPTALAVDAWGLRRGRDLVAESDRLKAAHADAYAAADFFAAGFDPDPRLLDVCLEPRRRAFLAQLFETPAYRTLHAATRLDDTAAAIAAAHFAEEYARLRHEEAARPADELGREVATLRAVGRALAGAGAEVEALHETAAALGLGAGSPGGHDARRVAEAFRRVRSDPALRRICESAGRFRRVAQSRQRRKVLHGPDDVVGVEPGGDIGRLLPVELAKLADPAFELDALRRLAERQAHCRETHFREPVGRGPVLVVLDESGSMEGDKIHTAKALALALAWVARRQRRWCGLIAYSGDSGERLLALPPGRWDETALCEWLSAFIGRGSTLDVPVREMPDYARRLGAPRGLTDLLFVTDAQCRIDASDRATFLNWKREARVRVVSLVLNPSAGDLAAVSDEVHTVATLAPGDEAVGSVLSR